MTAVLFACLLFLNCHSQTLTNIETIPPKAFAEKINTTPNAQILDVRTPAEYAGEHIDHAINVNWNADDFATKAAQYDKSRPVFVYCKVGGRSSQAAAKLNEMGFTKIYNLDGGMMKWNAAGLSEPSDKIIGMCDQEYGEMVKKDARVLVNFYADWCAPCIKMKPYMLKLQQEKKGQVNIVRLNADENKTMISKLKIDELPALLLYENGELKWQHKGFIGEADLKKQL